MPFTALLKHVTNSHNTLNTEKFLKNPKSSRIFMIKIHFYHVLHALSDGIMKYALSFLSPSYMSGIPTHKGGPGKRFSPIEAN